MSIIITAQSLKNDGGADLQIDGEYSPKGDCSVKMNAFYTNLEKVKFVDKGNGIEYGSLRKGMRLPTFCLNVLCEEKDDVGRGSPICIQAGISEIDSIIKHLDSFLEKSNRTISKEKREIIKGIIKSKSKGINWLFNSGAVILVSYCLYRMFKSGGNAE